MSRKLYQYMPALSVVGDPATVPPVVVRRGQQDKGRKRYQCRYCPYSTACFAHVTKHERTHTGEKPFRCTVCSKSFSEKSNQRAHMRTHTGEKPYWCCICPRRFTNRSSLQAHMKTHYRQPQRGYYDQSLV
ncbi:hypothetical protein V5799_004008 [Amblyomma americanum]|uniref:C2H2-type domain-containing protein n=1 Tax=Amblyomma americanum TaxID=6943 RepID=A0AAQ4D7B9_AMBAM